MITTLARLGMMGLLVAAATAGTQTHKADKANSKDAGAAKAVPTKAALPAPARKEATKGLAPLPIKLPKPRIIGTLSNVPLGAHVKVTKGPVKLREPFLAPKGAKNVAAKRPVIASDTEPVIGTLDLITDGSKEADQDSYVELGPGVQWVQIDLGAAHEIQAIVAWHEHRQPMVYYDVIVQISDDKDFIENVRTLFNNDHDNSAGMGIGEGWGYFETYEGQLFPARGARARYVRLYSNGNTGDDLNRYTEVEVYALPPGAGKAAAKAAPAGKPDKPGK